MAKRGKRRMTYLMIGLAALIILGALCYFVFFSAKKYHFNRIDEVLYNPFMGFAISADNPDAVQENTVVYVDVTWRELEPAEGDFCFSEIREDNFLEKWKSEGKHVVFRFVCDVPGEDEHMDIPDWLYEKTKDGMFYDSDYGKGYSPEYDNQTFISYHEKAIAALGREFGKDSFFSYIELGSLGHWGEWHVKYDEGMPKIPGEETCEKYILPYLSAFPNAKVLMRRPFSWVETYGLGVFNDMTGHPGDTKEWLSWISGGGKYTEPKTPHSLSACPDIAKSSPVGGEFTSSISMKEMLSDELDQTVSLIRDSHMTFIGPKCPKQEERENYGEGVKAVQKSIGYRYGISWASIQSKRTSGGILVKLKLENNGAAPMYQNWPVYLYLLDAGGNITDRKKVPVDIAEIAGGESREIEAWLEDTGEKEQRVGVGLEDPETKKPGVSLDMDVEMIGKIAVLGTVD